MLHHSMSFCCLSLLSLCFVVPSSGCPPFYHLSVSRLFPLRFFPQVLLEYLQVVPYLSIMLPLAVPKKDLPDLLILGLMVFDASMIIMQEFLSSPLFFFTCVKGHPLH